MNSLRQRVLICLVLPAFFLSWCAVASDQFIPGKPAVPGGIAVVNLGADDTEAPVARFGRKLILVLKRNGTWLGIVGIGLSTPLGNYLVTAVTSSGEAVSEEFSVIPNNYTFNPGHNNNLVPPEHNSPLDGHGDLMANLPLMTPVDATVTGNFGNRYLDGDKTVFTDSADFKLSQNTEVKAPGGGTISELVELLDTGWYVLIDHGMGLYSYLGPMQELRVTVGDEVRKGNVLGEFDIDLISSRSVRWWVSLNGAVINPLLFVPTIPGD